MGVPSKLKTDNGPAYIGHRFKQFCKEWNIVHVTGLSYNPQGQATVERAHKTQLLKIKKEEPLRYLSINTFHFNFFNLPQGDILTAADKHFGEPPSLPDIQVPIWYKSFNSWLPVLLLKKGKGYACVSTDVHGSPETFWVPLRSIRPRKTNEHVQKSDDCPSEGDS
jgi:transposase InsO family protein